MKTWMMYKNHYGGSMPSPVHQSDLRENRRKIYTSQPGTSSAAKRDSSRTESYPARFYGYQLIVLGMMILFGIALIAGYAPELALFMGL